ncbi:hypothetical protein HY418_00965 [Candidatus Kaiserbacteria bacterium]|nr:hypothetical protein [Candidatus Kaiserbacteria bacterium]
MKLGFSKGAKQKVVAVADVGSGSAGFAVLEVPAKGPSIVHAAERAILPIEQRSPEVAIAAVGAELQRVGEKMLKAYTERKARNTPLPESVLCVIRAPWTRSQAVREATRFEKETLIGPSLVSDLAKKALQHVSGIEKNDYLDATVARVELNGYPTKKPEGKHAHEIAVTALISGCDPAIRAAVEHSLEALMPHTPRILRSGSRALLSVMREYSPGQDYVIIDMGGEGATIIAVRDGAPAEQSIVSEGIYSVLRRLSGAGMPEEVLGMMRMIARDQCTSTACEATAQALARIEPELVKAFGEGMAKCALLRRLPNSLFVVTHPDMALWLSQFFSRIDFTQFTQTAQPFVVKVLAPKNMAAWVSPASGITLDCGMAVPAALVNIEAGSQI